MTNHASMTDFSKFARALDEIDTQINSLFTEMNNGGDLNYLALDRLRAHATQTRNAFRDVMNARRQSKELINDSHSNH